MLRMLSLLIILPYVSADAEWCSGDLLWQNAASSCIPTCTAHFYPDKELCPNRTIARCVCPEDKVKLDDTSDVCVDPLSQECRQATRKYMDDPSTQFKFSKEPEDVEVMVGETVTLSCLVSNNYTIQYIWYKLEELPYGDGTAETNLYMTGTSELVFRNITPGEAGFYQCKAVASSDFLMISGVGEIRVKHFTTEPIEISNPRSTFNNPLIKIKCTEINAYPTPTIRWYFNDSIIDFMDPSYFVNRNKDSAEYGTLYIQNFEEKHEGKYTCEGNSEALGITRVLAERHVSHFGSQNTVTGAPSMVETANHGDKQRKGETGEMYCAGYGFPAPQIKWFKLVAIGQDQPEISGCTESKCVDQGGRRLRIYNLGENDFGDYRCVAENGVGLLTKIIPMVKEYDSYAVKFEGISAPVKVLPNRYTGFTLTCQVNTSQNPETYMGWYQNTQGIADKGDRILIEGSSENGVSIQKLIFSFPTNDDHGVYQCLAYNSKTFKQATTDVFVYSTVTDDTGPGYKSDSVFGANAYGAAADKEYKYFSESRNAAEADKACQEWRKGAHLASILSYRENDEVFNILMASKNLTNETRAWIGLTDETTEGMWLWLSGEVSDRFSFWWKNEPDNSQQERDYAFMDAAKSGHWLGGDFDLELPFVCKNYNGSCADLAALTELEITFVEYTEKRLGSQISVNDEVSVQCGGVLATLQCAPTGKWVLAPGSSCPNIETLREKEQPPTGAATSNQLQTLILTLILSYLLT